MSFYDVKTRSIKTIVPGIHARTFWGENLTLAVVDLEANAVLPTHNHPHEQGGYLLEGEFELTIGDETRTIQAGDLYVIPGGVNHTVKVGSKPTRVLDIFSPVREDFKY